MLNAVRGGDSRLAWKLLESQGLTKPPKPGSTDVRELQLRQEIDRRKQEVAERKDMSELIQDDLLTVDMEEGINDE